MSPRPSKRLRTASPSGWMECEDLTCVPMPHLLGNDKGQSPYLRAPLASAVSKEIFVDRFRKEIIQPFHFSVNSQVQIRPGELVHDAKQRRQIIQSRIVVGISVCSKVLSSHGMGGDTADEAPAAPPLDLLVLCADFTPARFASHLPLLAHQHQVPLLLLPGDSSSTELGAALGIRCAGVVGFRPPPPPPDVNLTGEAQEIHNAITSFVAFIKGQIQF